MNAVKAGKCPSPAVSRRFWGMERMRATAHCAGMRAVIAIVSISLLAGCSSQVDKQLEAVKSARTVLSEWALLEEQADKGRVQATYAEQMRDDAKDELGKASTGLAQQPEAARLVDGLRTGSPDAAALKRAASSLEPLENSLEAA